MTSCPWIPSSVTDDHDPTLFILHLGHHDHFLPVHSLSGSLIPITIILFNVYTYDIIEAIQEEDVKPYTYADDILVHTVDPTPVGAAAKQQWASNKAAQWVSNKDQSIQSDQSSCRSQFTLTYNGGVVPQENEVVYLGIMMDRHMTMAQHLQRL